MEKGIAVSNKSGNTWSTPKKLMIPNFDEDGNFYGMYINDEETVIILSSSGVNSFGQEDLFVSTFNGTNWSSLLNLGNKINSTGFEISPFMLGDTLFFSSNGHGGYGDADIFYSIKGETWTDWSEPINLGDKINSKKFDAYFHYSDKKIFWSSNRDTFTYSNIYSASYEYIDYLDVSSSKKDVTVYKGNDGGITLKVKGGKGPFTYKWSNGSIDSNLYNIPSGNYDITVSDASGQSKTLTIFITEPVEIVADTLKKGDDLGKILNLKPIYFNLNKYELRKDAFEELDKIVKVMNEYPNMKIEIGSHTDCRGSKQYNASLSANRAKSTVKYIQKRITNPSRLTGKGYGESKLIVDCPCESNLVSKCEEEEHQKNRRSEFIIISK
jgi:outer membrane protein OmpA-like peptidoglycan-associated protein